MKKTGAISAALAVGCGLGGAGRHGQELQGSIHASSPD